MNEIKDLTNAISKQKKEKALEIATAKAENYKAAENTIKAGLSLLDGIISKDIIVKVVDANVVMPSFIENGVITAETADALLETNEVMIIAKYQTILKEGSIVSAFLAEYINTAKAKDFVVNEINKGLKTIFQEKVLDTIKLSEGRTSLRVTNEELKVDNKDLSLLNFVKLEDAGVIFSNNVITALENEGFTVGTCLKENQGVNGDIDYTYNTVDFDEYGQVKIFVIKKGKKYIAKVKKGSFSILNSANPIENKILAKILKVLVKNKFIISFEGQTERSVKDFLKKNQDTLEMSSSYDSAFLDISKVEDDSPSTILENPFSIEG